MATAGPRLGGPAFSGVVLAGGASTRMGVDKALIDMGDRKLVELSTDALSRAGAAEVFVVGGSQVEIERLGLHWVRDQFPGEGPLGGVITGLDAAGEETVAVLACDHTHASEDAVRAVVGTLGDSDGDVVVPVVSGVQQVLHAAWRRSVRAALRGAFETGARSVREGMKALTIVELVDADPGWFDDADTPADLPRRTL
ncbi:MAG: molybdenum cofactor guanylyltransferase [Acidimicrobiales bacterium]